MDVKKIKTKLRQWFVGGEDVEYVGKQLWEKDDEGKE